MHRVVGINVSLRGFLAQMPAEQLCELRLCLRLQLCYEGVDGPVRDRVLPSLQEDTGVLPPESGQPAWQILCLQSLHSSMDVSQI